MRTIDELERFKYLKNNEIDSIISVKGGRFEVDLIELLKKPVYWFDSKVIVSKVYFS
jgi:hypothetical protein